MKGGTSNVQQVVKQVSKFHGKKVDDSLEWSSIFCGSLSLHNEPILNILQGLQRPSELDNNQMTACKA